MAEGLSSRRSSTGSGPRAKTDDSLRAERLDTDGALKGDIAAAERHADDVANRDDFLGMVAHDVRNLLNGVTLNLELLAPAGRPAGDPQVAAATARIRRDVGRMNRLIGDLVDVTSIDAGKLAIVPVEGDAAALVVEATDTFQASAREKGVSLSAEVPARPLLAPFDHERLLQVFANLIANAIKFTPPGGVIRVGIDTPRGLTRFHVSDTGEGIPGPLLESVFERFWQVGRNDRRGMGLGLYISKSIVDAHGGRIWAESDPGKGARVYFTLPVPGAQKLMRTGRSPVRGHERAARRGKETADRRRRK